MPSEADLPGMRLSCYAVLLIAFASGAPAGAAVEFKVFTQAGFVAFAAEDHWPVVALETKPPVAVAVFQVPNPADAGTPEATNLSITIVQDDSTPARAALARVGQRLGREAPRVERLLGWTVFRQQAEQGAVSYEVVDAKRHLVAGTVAVRLAWPHLEANPSDYDRRMEMILR